MVEKRLRGALGLVMLTLSAGACTEATPAASKQDPAAGKTSIALSGSPRVLATDPGGVPTFITGAFGAVPREPGAVASVQAEQLAPVLSEVAPLFRLDPSNLRLKKAYVGFDGDAHFRYDVSHNGIEVLGAELRLHARDGAVFAANTNARGDLPAPDKAAIPPEQAIEAARQDRASPARATVEGEPRLVYWRDDDALVLAYEVRVKGQQADGTPVDDSVLVNARTGDAFAHLPHIHSALYRVVYDGRSQPYPGVPARTEGQPPVADPVVNEAYDNLGSVYHCYQGLFGRDSYDNAGAHLVATVHYLNNYVNAYWDGTQLLYGDGDGTTSANLAYSLDITAHELTHAVTDTESGLIYSGESGALNESMSDVFGAVCEWYDHGKVLTPGTWIIGDEVWTPSIPGDGLRYLNDPALDGDSLDYYPDYSSGVDVHYGSGISNLAFYLLSQGGTHPRNKTTISVAGIGIEKAARVFYKMNVDLMLPATNFYSAKVYAEQAAFQLGYDTDTVTSVSNAWKAVYVGIPHIPPPPPLQQNVPVTGLEGAKSEKKYYSVVVPEGAQDLTFTMAGGTGDADLYVRRGNAPTTTTYDCRPYKAGNNEVCTFPAPEPGPWYVMLNGFEAYSGVSLTVTWKNGYIPLEPNVEVRGLSGGEDSFQVFTLLLPERSDGGTRNLHVRLQGGGNADLSVRRGAAPTRGRYDCRDVKEHSTENCNLNNTAPGKYYIEVFGAKGGYQDVSLIATYN